MIENKKVQKDGKWFVYSEDGKKKLGGPYDTEAEADKRLKEVETFKHTKNTLITMKSTVSPIVRNDRMEDRDWVVVPMIMMVEGVHSGSCGALYYPSTELEKTPASWNHKPVVVYHPDGPTACDPDVLTNRKVGVIMNTKFEDGKLKAEAWLDPVRMKKVDNRIAEAVENKTVMELSTGLFTDLEGPGGEWNEESYDAIAKNYRPDHLALLPDQTGACSVKDGAGFLRLNSETKKEKELTINVSWAKTFFPFLQAAGIDTDKLVSNELSHGEIWGQLSKKLQEKQSKADDGLPTIWNYLVEVFSDYVIYEGESGKLFKQNYEVKENVVSLTGIPEEVVRMVSYKSVTNNKEDIVQKGNKMDKKSELIQKLTSNEMSGWTEKDKEMLDSMTENQLEALIGKIPEKKPEPKVENKEVEEKEPTPVVNVETKEPEKTPMTASEYIANAPKEIQNVLNEGMAAFNAEKTRLIDAVLANAQNPFSKEFLATKNMDELRGLVKLAGTSVKSTDAVQMFNYGGQAEPVVSNTKITLLDLPSLTFETK